MIKLTVTRSITPYKFMHRGTIVEENATEAAGTRRLARFPPNGELFVTRLPPP
ncbi:hypothetical protein [Bradyrhizobium sp. AC87j1]|uniref:hypothetical protein n=1 Tax=Bradyrhizobium sp. AC87j1 TaxID=2055894 RepID=UPI0013751477|nr:hypothetical protein [Bradyrhizobium sp. AC87j1]